MNKRLLLMTTFILTIFCFNIKEVDAYSADNYKDRNLCAAYELAGFHSDGVIDQVGCYASYEEAKNAMVTNAADDLAIMTVVDGKVKIVDANVALLDLSVNPETLTYFYENAGDNNRTYTYMDTGSLYGGTDGAHIETVYNSYGWNVKTKIGNFTGWIRQSTYEIVPITWVKSSSHYTVNTNITHNYTAKIQNDYVSAGSSTIGPKPDMLNTGTYYSFDGHYFYSDLKTMIKDYKAGNYNNSVNKDKEYYNYYMYLSNHTKTNYSSINIDNYLRNNMNYSGDVYGSKAGSGRSKLYGMGTFFYHAQEQGGANAMLSLSLSRNETGNGRSNISIKNNNGFGLGAVDSSPGQSANWYATFSSSILGYASKWITYGYAHPRDWRYFGPQFGDKGIGMNVKYASDTYWSEKMAANYYSMDAAMGLQDYNYYQLGVVTAPVDARTDANASSKFLYTYPEKEDAVVIIGEKEGQTINGDATWYKIVSDLNLDSSFNELPEGSDYNWNSYAYIPASYVKKINKAKDGYKSPTDVFEYQDKDYTYDLMVKDTVLSPKVGLSIKETSYYYDPTLTQTKNQKLLNNRYVIIHAIAYDENKKEKAYLVSSDYMNNDEHWVPADSIKEVALKYGKVSVDVPDVNAYTWVNYNTVDSESTKIGGLYKYAIVPVLEEKVVDGNTWLKIPYNLSGTSNEFGWTLKTANYVNIEVFTTTVANKPPVINATNKTIVQGQTFDPMQGVTATDSEDGNITKNISVVENTVNNKVTGTYKVKYQVTDSGKETVIKEITVTVKENQKPTINAKDKVVNLNSTFNPLDGVTATDPEDGNITNITVIGTVNTKVIGKYTIKYSVTDSFNQKVEKTVTIEVKEVDISKKDGEFYLESLKWNNTTKKYEISGYLIILNSNNGLKDAKYQLILKDKKTGTKYEKDIAAWLDKVPYDLGKENGNDYSISWFKDSFSLNDLPKGDYELYMKAVKGTYYSEELVTNMFNKTIDRRVQDNNKGFNLKVELSLASKKIELNVRDGQMITTSTSNTFRNMINNYDDIKFVNSKLNLIGTSYNYGGTYKNKSDITRTLIIENTTTYEQYKFNIGATNTGSYKVTSSDNLNKDYAWYNATIDVSSLPKGTYSMIVHTKTKDSEDYGEINDIFGMINKAEATINNKKYKVSLNKQRMNRIELIVE